MGNGLVSQVLVVSVGDLSLNTQHELSVVFCHPGFGVLGG